MKKTILIILLVVISLSFAFAQKGKSKGNPNHKTATKEELIGKWKIVDLKRYDSKDENAMSDDEEVKIAKNYMLSKGYSINFLNKDKMIYEVDGKSEETNWKLNGMKLKRIKHISETMTSTSVHRIRLVEGGLLEVGSTDKVNGSYIRMVFKKE